jgi:hypothetical protein
MPTHIKEGETGFLSLEVLVIFFIVYWEVASLIKTINEASNGRK